MKYIIVGGFTNSDDAITAFHDQLQIHQGIDAQIITLPQALADPDALKTACDDSFVISHSGGLTALAIHDAKPRKLVANGPPTNIPMSLAMKRAFPIAKSINNAGHSIRPKPNELVFQRTVLEADLRKVLDSFDDVTIVLMKNDEYFRPHEYPGLEDYEVIALNFSHGSIFTEPAEYLAALLAKKPAVFDYE